MKYGFVLSKGTASETLDLATEAEDAGWDGVFTWDAISIGATLVYDPWVMMGAIAGVTDRVTIGAMILPLSRRRPWKVVKEAVTIDHLSNGRLVLPVALGVPDDAGYHGVNTDSTDRKERAQRLDEALEILEIGQTGEKFSYDGKHFQVTDMTLLPKPAQPGSSKAAGTTTRLRHRCWHVYAKVHRGLRPRYRSGKPVCLPRFGSYRPSVRARK